MCCQYFMEMDPELRDIVEEMNQSPLTWKMVDKLGRRATTEGVVRPTNIVPAVASSSHGSRAVFPMVFGFSPAGGASVPLINARVETAGQKPTFKEAWKSHRCIIPASYYFEWVHLVNPATGKKKTGEKYLIQPKGAQLAWLAGLYRIEEKSGMRYPAFTILTREPGEEIRFIHDRMPVILPRELVDSWIQPDSDPEDIVKEAITDVAFEKTK